jgi:hypothetical protein
MNLVTLRLWTFFGFKLLSTLQVLYQINLVALLLYILLHLNCYLLNLEQKSIRKHFIIKSVFFLCRLANVCTLTTFFFKSSCLSVQFKFKFKLCCIFLKNVILESASTLCCFQKLYCSFNFSKI